MAELIKPQRDAYGGLAGRALSHVLPDLYAALMNLLPQLSRYTLASVAALGADFTFYVLLISASVKPTLAGIAGYAVGIIIHYVLSTRYVFYHAVASKSEQRQFVEFAFSGIAGILLTGFIIALSTGPLGMSAIAAKVIAVTISFAAVFAIRRSFVFAT